MTAFSELFMSTWMIRTDSDDRIIQNWRLHEGCGVVHVLTQIVNIMRAFDLDSTLAVYCHSLPENTFINCFA